MQGHHNDNPDADYDDDPDDRRNRFLPDAGNGNGGGNGQRAASQPPHHSATSFLSSPPTQHLVPSSLGGSGGGLWGGHGHGHGLSSSTRSSSFSTPRFASTFEDDELLDGDGEDDELYDARYGSGAGYRGRTYAADLARSRSQSLATAPVGSGRTPSAAFSIPGTQRYGELPGSRYGSLGSASLGLARSPHTHAGSPLARGDASNMSPFVRDVGQILLDDGSFRELWERERHLSSSSSLSHSHAAHNLAHSFSNNEHEGGGGSGTTSRRHSVSIVQPRRLAGFNAPDSSEQDFGAAFSSSSFANNAGFAAAAGAGSGLGLGAGRGFSSSVGLGGRGGGGGLLLSDDDLEGLGSLPCPRPPRRPEPPATTAVDMPEEQEEGAQVQGASRSTRPSGARRPRSRTPRGPRRTRTSPRRRSRRRRASTRRRSTASAASRRTASAPTEGQAGVAVPRARGRGADEPAEPARGRPGRGAGQGPQGLQSHAGVGLGQGGQGGQAQAELGKGLPLHAVPPDWPLYIVEFKAGRTDLFYRAGGPGGAGGRGRECFLLVLTSSLFDDDAIRVGDLVIVEADRGKDLGKVVNDSITLGEVEAFWAGQARYTSQGSGQSPPTSPGGADGGGKKEIAPKMIYGKAGAGDAQLLVAKMQDEQKALALCQTKVRAKKLPMEVVDAEYQWDRRKLTFYFVAEKRIDFRELVRELFRLYKTRIWMASLQGAGGFEQ
ncbi:PSP1 C-terminal conserved region-domain-containing protein [Mycena latifolia]|nr:PSP1 C-terminal conserved region-domain-containing protein [Mycena latifolia]